MESDVLSGITAIFMVILLAWLYFLPAFVAWWRFHPNKAPILIINLFFGWTLLGWVICLAWSFSQIKTVANKKAPEPLG